MSFWIMRLCHCMVCVIFFCSLALLSFPYACLLVGRNSDDNLWCRWHVEIRAAMHRIINECSTWSWSIDVYTCVCVSRNERPRAVHILSNKYYYKRWQTNTAPQDVYASHDDFRYDYDDNADDDGGGGWFFCVCVLCVDGNWSAMTRRNSSVCVFCALHHAP